jgi:hypothetical protein
MRYRRGGVSYWLSVWTFDQLECGNVSGSQPRLKRSPADFTGCVTGVRCQELCFSAFILSTAIALDDCRHSRNMRLRLARSSRIRRQNQTDPVRNGTTKAAWEGLATS